MRSSEIDAVPYTLGRPDSKGPHLAEGLSITGLFKG